MHNVHQLDSIKSGAHPINLSMLLKKIPVPELGVAQIVLLNNTHVFEVNEIEINHFEVNDAFDQQISIKNPIDYAWASLGINGIRCLETIVENYEVTENPRC